MTAPAIEAVDVAGERAAVIAEALSWLGTPFHHAARVKGAGVDCANLLVAAYASVGVVPPSIERYGPQWFLSRGEERLLAVVEPLCAPIGDGAIPEPGDIALFRFGRAVSHAGIVIDQARVFGRLPGRAPRIVHAFVRRGVVRDTVSPASMLGARLVGYWRPRRWVV